LNGGGKLKLKSVWEKAESMSWFFGSKAPQPPVIPTDFNPPGGGAPPSGNDPPEKSGSRAAESSYRFDSAALERAAQAARELERSSHAKEVRLHHHLK